MYYMFVLCVCQYCYRVLVIVGKVILRDFEMVFGVGFKVVLGIFEYFIVRKVVLVNCVL